jgi:two-component system, NarL family, response regulator NreC
MIKVLLVDDHQIFRDGIVSLFSDQDEISIAGVASNGEEALNKLHFIKPDVLLLDISMPGKSGIEVISEAKTILPDIKILILSMHTGEDYIFKAIRAGASGFLAKQNTTKPELLKAISLLAKGKEYFNESIAVVMQQNYIKKARDIDDSVFDNYNRLSIREKEILKLVLEGLSNNEIASKLFVHIRTVETHKTNIMQKLGLKNSVELVKFAIKNDLYKL